MNHVLKTLSIAILVVAATSALSFAQQNLPAERDTLLTGSQWEAFNTNINKSIFSENEGVREGALKQIAYYGDYLSFSELSVFEVMRMYRDSDNPRIKRLAVVALGNMGSRWAIEFLDMLAPYEKNDQLRQTMESVVRKGRAEHE